MRANKKPGPCEDCGTHVDALAGFLLGPAGGWKTVCVEHRPVAPPRTRPGAWESPGLASFDLETTGVDPHEDRIVSIGLIDETGREYALVVNPGVPIPSRASEVHGIHDADVAGAVEARAGVQWVVDWLSVAIARRVPVVVYNAPYDLSMVRAEAKRHGIEQPDWSSLLVVDPLVVDWGIWRGRLGPCKLTDASEFYGVALDDAHDSLADARAARLVAFEMAAREAVLDGLSSTDLMEAQRAWFAERTEDWNRWSVKQGRAAENPAGWPLSASTT